MSGSFTGFFQSIWTHGVKPHLGVPGEKMVVLMDWKPGLVLRLGQLATLIYAFYMCLIGQQYLAELAVTAEFSLQVDASSSAASQQKMTLNSSFCSEVRRGQYNFTHSSNIKFNFTGCIAPQAEGMFIQEKDAVFFPTTKSMTYIKRVEAPRFNASEAECRDFMRRLMNGKECHEWWEISSAYGTRYFYELNMAAFKGSNTQSNGTCGCQATSTSLVVGSEVVLMEVNHQVRLSVEQGSSIVPVDTRVRRPGSHDDLARFAPGEAVRGNLSEWLNWAGVDLDQRADQGINLQWFDTEWYEKVNILQGPLGRELEGAFPFLRVSGLQLAVHFEYFNYGTAPGHKRGFFDLNEPMVCVMSITPHYLWLPSRGSYMYLSTFPEPQRVASREGSTGIYMSVDLGTSLWKFSIFALISTLVEVVVLLNVSSTVAVIYARFLMGDKSRFYGNVIVEKVSVAREYAQFAIRAIIASCFFDLLDEDESGEISVSEMFSYLRSITLAQGVNTEQTGSLVEFMLEAADTGLDQQVSEDEDNEDGSSDDEDKFQSALASQRSIPQTPRTPRRTFRWRNHSLHTLEHFSHTLKCFYHSLKQLFQTLLKPFRRAKPETFEEEMARRIAEFEAQFEDELDRSTVNKEEWVNIFVGPPCTVRSCVDLINRKNLQDRYTISEEMAARYRRKDKEIKDNFIKKVQIAKLGLKMEPKLTSKDVMKRGARVCGRQGKDCIAMRKELKHMQKSVKRLGKELADKRKHKINDAIEDSQSTSSISISTQTENSVLRPKG